MIMGENTKQINSPDPEPSLYGFEIFASIYTPYYHSLYGA